MKVDETLFDSEFKRLEPIFSIERDVASNSLIRSLLFGMLSNVTVKLLKTALMNSDLAKGTDRDIPLVRLNTVMRTVKGRQSLQPLIDEFRPFSFFSRTRYYDVSAYADDLKDLLSGRRAVPQFGIEASWKDEEFNTKLKEFCHEHRVLSRDQ